MKRIKHYSVRKNYAKSITKKILISNTVIIFAIFLVNFFGLNQLSTDVLGRILSPQLLEKANKITFNGTIWPIKEITNLSYKAIRSSNMTYGKLREENWNQIPDTLRTTFPKIIGSYIRKYQNITLQKAWNVFKDSEELNGFIFKRRIIRATWTASYESKNIWKKNSGTHAGVDFIANVGTPLYAIANGLVVQKKQGNKGFGNHIDILIKVDGKYYIVFYGHMHSLNNNIKVGDFVKKGENVGTVGRSGNAFGAHLHLQINKVVKLQDIVSGKVMNGWFHNIDGVKKNTIDPIAFIEKYHTVAGDDLADIKKHINNTDSKNITSTKKESSISKEEIKTTKKNTDLLVSISNKNNKEVVVHNAALEKTYIKDIDLKLMDNKIQLGHSFNVNLSIQPGHGIIGIIASNENLQFTIDKIENPLKKQYTIPFIAKSVGKTILTFNDGKSIHTYNINIYKKETENVYGIKVKTDNLNLLSASKITIYPTNKFGQIISNNIKGIFKIYIDINGNKKLLEHIQVDGLKYTGYIRGNLYGKGKLIVESDRFYSKTNITVDIAKDYKYNDSYAYSMFQLIKNGIVHGENGKLYPYRKLTRRELLTIIGRSILNKDLKKLKLEMQEYIKKSGRFFKDISGNAYSDPYVYLAWKEKIIKGENNYSLSNTYVTKGELLTIFTRLFNIKLESDSLNFWTDLKQGTNLKKIADTTKRYGLYPFKNYNTFNAGKDISRLYAFETLQEFLNYKGKDNKYVSSNTKKQELKKEFDNIFAF